jgi:hypothetical protein
LTDEEADMLFLFQGRYGVAARLVIGAALVVIGLIIHGGVVLVVIGAVLLVWGAVMGARSLRSRDGGARAGSRQ